MHYTKSPISCRIHIGCICSSDDIDIIVDFSKPIGIEFIDLADFIEKTLNKKVDLVSKKGIKKKY